jgi:hypothetical protein
MTDYHCGKWTADNNDIEPFNCEIIFEKFPQKRFGYYSSERTNVRQA